MEGGRGHGCSQSLRHLLRIRPKAGPSSPGKPWISTGRRSRFWRNVAKITRSCEIGFRQRGVDAGAGGVWRRSFAGLAEAGEQQKVMLIAPDGIKASNDKRAWNDSRADATSNASADVIGFLAVLIDSAIAEFGADQQRIYVFGTSNGGGMAYRAGIELGPKLAAIGVQSQKRRGNYPSSNSGNSRLSSLTRSALQNTGSSTRQR